MGQPEFYSPIKSDVDAIQQTTNTINADTQQIQTSVDEIKNTDLSNVSNKIGVFGDDTTKQTLFGQISTVKDIAIIEGFKPYTLISTYNAPVPNTYNSVFQIAGEGFLSALTVSIRGTTAANALFKILIDGVEQMRNKTSQQINSPYAQNGLMSVDTLPDDPSSTAFYYWNNSGITQALAEQLPYINENTNVNIVIPTPLIFKQSLELQILCSDFTTHDYFFFGGLK